MYDINKASATPGHRGRAGALVGPRRPADEQGAGDRRTLGPDQAARHLGLRRREFTALVEAGLLVAVEERTKGWPAQYALQDIEDLAARTDLDWEAARAARRWERSPWRSLAGPIPQRDDAVRDLVARLQADGVEAWRRYRYSSDRWTVDWVPGVGAPTVDEVVEMLPDRLYRAWRVDRLVLLSRAGEAMHWAYRILQPDSGAVLVDLETTGLGPDARIVEVAAMRAHDGAVLLNSLVDPGVRIPASATRIHGITDAMVAGQPGWDQVLPQLQAAVRGPAISYNAEFERKLISQHGRALGLAPSPLQRHEAWDCLMAARSAWLGTTSRLGLRGPHRALGDCHAARDLLTRLTRRPEWTLQDE